MSIDEAYAAVQFYGNNLWDALENMDKNWDDLDIYDKAAFKTVKQELEKEMK